VKRLRHLMVILVALAIAIPTVALQPALTTGQTKLVMVFVPSGEAEAILFSGQQLGRMLGVALGIPVEALVSTSYVAAIEAMCAGRADIGALNAFSYVLAHQKCGVEVAAVSVRFGLPYYLSQISVRADAGINKIEDLRGKRFAFVDPASTSGYLFPAAMLKKLGYDPDKFFSRTYFTRALKDHAGMVLRRLSGKTESTAPVLTLITQFGGGNRGQSARLSTQPLRSLLSLSPSNTLCLSKEVAASWPIPADTWHTGHVCSVDLLGFSERP